MRTNALNFKNTLQLLLLDLVVMLLSKKEDNRVLFNLLYTSIYGAESSFLQIPANILSVVLSKNTKLFFFSWSQFEKTSNTLEILTGEKVYLGAVEAYSFLCRK